MLTRQLVHCTAVLVGGTRQCLRVILELRFASKPSKFCGSSRRNATRDGAKPPQAGSTESLMFLFWGKELFYHKKCKFAYVGVDQTRRRPLAVLLFRNCCKRNYVSKDNGQFQKAKLRLRRLFSLQPKVQHYSTPASLRVTKSADGFGCMRSIVSPTSKTAKAVFGTLGSKRGAYGYSYVSP